MRDALRSAALFADLPDEDLDCLVAGAFEEKVGAGELLFAEGDDGDRACLILDGEVEILKTSGTREVLLAVRRAGDVIGEMALLDAAPRMATVRARTESRLLSIPKQQMDELLESSVTAGRALFAVLLARWRETEARLRQSERMAQIGTLTAGLAHEMNNPAAAIARAGAQLGEAVDRMEKASGALRAAGIDPDGDPVAAVLARAGEVPAPLSTVERSDREAEVEDLLDDSAIPEAWRLAPEVVGAGLTAGELGPVLDAITDDARGTFIEAIAATADVSGLVREVEEGAGRLSAIVGALKSYSHLDRAAVQEVDIHRGLEDTLTILKQKLESIEVRREYRPGELLAEVYASELNQVWTNLIDNAADALADTDGATITLRTEADDAWVTVEVEDNGPGIPPDTIDRIFDAFFTTKAPGAGTGLGLDISHGIVVDTHGGEITVTSEPGRTVFRVVVPRRQSD
jgi:signal transduction histidine kinase